MTDMNHVSLIGHLTRNLDEQSFGYTNNSQARANVSIAVNRSKKSGDQWVEEVSFFDITIWGKTAENLKPYLIKGKQIAVEGFLKQERWSKDGQKFSKVSIVATNVQLLGGKDGSTESGDAKQGYKATDNSGFKPELENNENTDTGFEDDSDIPF